MKRNSFFLCVVTACVLAIFGCQEKEKYAEFIQVSIWRLDAGVFDVKTVRVDAKGYLETALWRDNGLLISLSERTNASEGLLDSFASYLSYPATKKALGRRALVVDIALHRNNNVQFVTFDEIPEGLDLLFSEVFNSVPAINPLPGRYILTAPFANIGMVDLDLIGNECNSAMSCSISRALTTGQLIIPAPNNIESFFDRSRVNRLQFGVRTQSGRFRFMVLTAY